MGTFVFYVDRTLEAGQSTPLERLRRQRMPQTRTAKPVENRPAKFDLEPPRQYPGEPKGDLVERGVGQAVPDSDVAAPGDEPDIDMDNQILSKPTSEGATRYGHVCSH